MQTLIIDILDKKALRLLQDLESLDLIRLRPELSEHNTTIDWANKYKGAMNKEPLANVDAQLSELRNAWD